MLFFHNLTRAGARAALAAALFQPAAAATLTTLKVLNGTTEGAYPTANLAADASGALYGAAALGGTGCDTAGCGVLFRLTPPAAAGGAWTYSVIYRFSGAADGSFPAGMMTGADGTIYGVTQYGGGNACLLGTTNVGCGTVFALVPPASAGGGFSVRTLYRFASGPTGNFPNRGLDQDRFGRLIVTTSAGGACATCGAVIRLAPPTTGTAPWVATVLYAFKGGLDGGSPFGTPLVAPGGRIFGTASIGGYSGSAVCAAQNGCGAIFALTPPATSTAAPTYSVLRAPSAAQGIAPVGQPALDAAGNLYAVALNGGNQTACAPAAPAAPGCGTVLQLVPPAAGATRWTTNVIRRFSAGTDGLEPSAGLAWVNGALYGTTSGNGIQGFGSVWKMTPPATAGAAWGFTTLASFVNDANGAQPTAELLPLGGALYGTTLGRNGPAPARFGTIFRVVE